MTHDKGIVLVVDDEEISRRLMRVVLEEAGHRVHEAADGAEALRQVETCRPDVVLTDVVMPGMDGMEVCRRIKANPLTAHLPVLLVTSLADRDDRIQGMEAGADDFINKPADRQELVLRVRNAVRAKHLFDELQKKYLELRRMEELGESVVRMLEVDNMALAGAMERMCGQSAQREGGDHGQD